MQTEKGASLFGGRPGCFPPSWDLCTEDSTIVLTDKQHLPEVISDKCQG